MISRRQNSPLVKGLGVVSGMGGAGTGAGIGWGTSTGGSVAGTMGFSSGCGSLSAKVVMEQGTPLRSQGRAVTC